MPANDSPFWPLARMIVIGSIIAIYSTLAYKNGFDPKDVGLIVAAITGGGVLDGLQRKMS